MALRDAEFAITAERNRRDFALEFFAKLKTRATGASGPAPLGLHILWVSNSLLGRHWKLNEVPAVGDPTHIVEFGRGQRVFAGETQRRVAV